MYRFRSNVDTAALYTVSKYTYWSPASMTYQKLLASYL